ncbi:hypothetical protein BDR22DRAFT_432483 [Usnea florida]
MYFPNARTLITTALAATASTSSPGDPPIYPPPTLPPTLTPLFTLTINAGDSLAPIPRLLGGYQAVYPTLNGTICGPALNGTIYHGASSPHITDDGTFAFSHRHYFGETCDGEAFDIVQQGVGYFTREQTWMVVTIGGFYEYLQHVFLLAQNDVDLETKTTTVTVYGVNMQDEVASLP